MIKEGKMINEGLVLRMQGSVLLQSGLLRMYGSRLEGSG